MDQNLYTKWIKVADKATDNYNSLATYERVWSNTRILVDSINNGGLISYYYNSGAENVYDMLSDLRIINMHTVAEIIENFNSILFPNSSVPKDINVRNEVIGNLDERSNDLIQTIETKISSYIPEIETSLDKFLKTNLK
jgi:hypothetical protein